MATPRNTSKEKIKEGSLPEKSPRVVRFHGKAKKSEQQGNSRESQNGEQREGNLREIGAERKEKKHQGYRAAMQGQNHQEMKSQQKSSQCGSGVGRKKKEAW